jgi:hypothetical protein
LFLPGPSWLDDDAFTRNQRTVLWSADCLAEDAVTCKLVSGQNSRYREKYREFWAEYHPPLRQEFWNNPCWLSNSLILSSRDEVGEGPTSIPFSGQQRRDLSSLSGKNLTVAPTVGSPELVDCGRHHAPRQVQIDLFQQMVRICGGHELLASDR